MEKTSKTGVSGFEVPTFFDNPQKSEKNMFSHGFCWFFWKKNTRENPKQHIVGQNKKNNKKTLVLRLSNPFKPKPFKNWTPQSV